MIKLNAGAKWAWWSVSIFDKGLSFAEKAWRVFIFLFVAASGTVTGFVARVDPVLKSLGPIYWIAISLVTGLFLVVIYYFVKAAFCRQAEAEYFTRLAIPRSQLNPLSESFKDMIIYIEDLRLPIGGVHKKKHFKRCKFVGPATLGIMGGTINEFHFFNSADMIAVPSGSMLAGVVTLFECTVEDCEFVSITVITDQITGKAFQQSGATVRGLV